jgi:uncharacterized cupredoxin-like copper-binding protein
MKISPHVIRGTLLAALSLLTAACGERGAGGQAGGEKGRMIQVEMVENAFNPANLNVSSGETVTFRFTNNGSLAHEAFIGDEEAQQEHSEAMGNTSGGHDAHGSEEGIVVEPGGTAELSYTFEEDGQTLIGCHQPGHYEAGMKSTITVS